MIFAFVSMSVIFLGERYHGRGNIDSTTVLKIGIHSLSNATYAASEVQGASLLWRNAEQIEMPQDLLDFFYTSLEKIAGIPLVVNLFGDGENRPQRIDLSQPVPVPL